MKPMTINAMVAGVQAGRINAVVFISPNPSIGDSQTGCVESKWEGGIGDSRQVRPKPAKHLK
jgi:hypothetical protein